MASRTHVTRLTSSPRGAAGGMPDLQSARDTRNIPIDKVGVKNIRYPIVVLDRSKAQQHTVARVNMYVDLPHHFKGTHMSRFIEILNLYHGEISIDSMDVILQEMKSRLEASRAHLELDFPYFIERLPRVSGARSLMEYQCRMAGTLGEERDFVLGVSVPVTSLCPARGDQRPRRPQPAQPAQRRDPLHRPCLDRGAGRLAGGMRQRAGLCPAQARGRKGRHRTGLRPPDVRRRHRPRGDRKAAAVPAITWFRIECENFESIHNHSAYALVEGPPR